MHHDKNGRVLTAGDRVVIHGTVQTFTRSSHDYDNIVVETDEPMHPSEVRTRIVLNAGQVEKAGCKAMDLPAA